MTSIRVRLFGYLFVLFIVSFALLFNITTYFVSNEYVSFEKDAIIKSTRQLQKGYTDMLNILRVKAHDWSVWDDAYAFMKTGDKKFVDSNLSLETVCNLQVNYILFVDDEGKIILEKSCDLAKNTSLPLPNEFIYHLSKGRLLINHPDLKIYTGLIDTAQGPLIVTAQPIVASSGEGPARGTLIFAHFLVKENLKVYADPDSTIAFEQTTTRQDEDIIVEAKNDRLIASSFDIYDIYGNPVIRIISTSPRSIYENRLIIFQYLFVSLSSIGFLILLSQYFIVEYLISRKISALIKAVLKFQNNNKGVYSIDIPIITRQKDEFFTLQDTLNAMFKSLQSLSSTILVEQEKSQQYIDMMNSIIRVLDKDKKILLINKKGCDILEYKKEELLGKNWIHTMIPPPDQEKISNILDAIFTSDVDGDKLIENESELVTKSGKRRIILWRHTHIKDSSGNTTSIISSGIDITEEQDTRIQLEKRMKEMEELNKVIINRELVMVDLKKKLKQYEK